MTPLGLEQMVEGRDYVSEAAPVEDAGSSALARIRGLYREAEREQRLDLLVPGFEPKRGKPSDLGVRYRPLSDDEKDELAQRDDLRPSLDYLIAACECLLIRNEEGVLEPLRQGRALVGFDETGSTVLGLGVPSAEHGGSARDVVLAVFKRTPDPSAAASRHFLRWNQWVSGDGQIDEERLLGES